MTDEAIQPFQTQGKVRATFGACDGMHLIDDHRLHGRKDAPGLGCEHQEQRFRSGDENIRRMVDDGAPLLRCGVAAAYADPDFRRGQSRGLALIGYAAQRRFKILRHIDAQGLQRRDVQHPDAALGLSRRVSTITDGTCGRLPHQPVNCRKERAQGLTGAGGRSHQHVPTGANGRPCLPLRVSRAFERMLEPCLGRLRKQVQTFVHTFDYDISHRRQPLSSSTHSSTSPG